ncbi:mitochondrial Complex I (CI) NADH:ubiquinone oxidoreductase subunit ESSS/NESM/NDUFB11 [Andalucia godoyi]|uniref:Mitochondrial Complex I (CI) NADH:ubiquinone oxidoreductase subunit ESSS/NESM/NDUFB11 n=1 Tax=Andalucia godoyi TaxID=505711 RepID=A0A8K0F0X6_ANDGO|nr:mitochondrial Complex I (CI) NADH:ubiquinone oxidoreductase subunit ESSS/NESM/NDUFB11 [Andalucia godoyi]|eukprot:ANDGO_08598.mRNA.1 mitochondrial Complex I (CI) NADH:ubiquinone oxidoreductase subunit ESSS/NESM/NDUFB11
MFSRSRLLNSLRFVRGGGDAPIKEAGGRLFGEAPLAPGQTRKCESWERVYYFGMGGSFVLITLGLYAKPDTSMKTLARIEATAQDSQQKQ